MSVLLLTVLAVACTETRQVAVKRRGQIEEMRAAIRGDFERAGIPLRPRPVAQAPIEEEPPPVEEQPLPPQMKALRGLLSSIFRPL